MGIGLLRRGAHARRVVSLCRVKVGIISVGCWQEVEDVVVNHHH